MRMKVDMKGAYNLLFKDLNIFLIVVGIDKGNSDAIDE